MTVTKRRVKAESAEGTGKGFPLFRKTCYTQPSPIPHSYRARCVLNMDRLWSSAEIYSAPCSVLGIKYTCDVCKRNILLLLRPSSSADFPHRSTGGADITHTVRIKCAAKECPEVDLCPSCFSKGEEKDAHKAWHDYKIVVSSAASRVRHRCHAKYQSHLNRRHIRSQFSRKTGERTSKLSMKLLQRPCPLKHLTFLRRELLLITGLQQYGLGNWQDVAEHVGTRYKEECEKHYLDTYINDRKSGKPCMPVSLSLSQLSYGII